MSTCEELFTKAQVVGSLTEYKKAFEVANISIDDMLASTTRITLYDFPATISHSDRMVLAKAIEEWKDSIRGFAILETGGEAPCSTWFKYKSVDIFEDFKLERGYDDQKEIGLDIRETELMNTSNEFAGKLEDDGEGSSDVLYAQSDEDSSFHNSSDDEIIGGDED